MNNFKIFFEFLTQKLYKVLKIQRLHEINEVKCFLSFFAEQDFVDELLKNVVLEENFSNNNFKTDKAPEDPKKARWQSFKNLVVESEILKNVKKKKIFFSSYHSVNSVINLF